VEEHLAHIPMIDGSNPTAVIGKEKVEENRIDEGKKYFSSSNALAYYVQTLITSGIFAVEQGVRLS
jgi:hypothetical protein